MYILIDPDEPTSASLSDPDDFKAFKVVVVGSSEAARKAVEDLGTPAEDDHVFVDPKVLRALPGARDDDPDWRAGLQKMVEFAEGHGWTDSDGRIRAHIEQA